MARVLIVPNHSVREAVPRECGILHTKRGRVRRDDRLADGVLLCAHRNVTIVDTDRVHQIRLTGPVNVDPEIETGGTEAHKHKSIAGHGNRSRGSSEDPDHAVVGRVHVLVRADEHLGEEVKDERGAREAGGDRCATQTGERPQWN